MAEGDGIGPETWESWNEEIMIVFTGLESDLIPSLST